MKRKILILLAVIQISVICFTGCNFANNQDDINIEPEKSYIDTIKDEKRTMIIAVDLNEDGIDTLPIDNENLQTYFDYDNDRFREKTAWISEYDGLIVIDKNNDGIIEGGEEIFGNVNYDIFEYLLEYDENGDNIISSEDTVFNNLFIWQDTNKNAIFDDDEELINLSELDIISISWASVENFITDKNSNDHIVEIRLNKNDGESLLGEVILLQHSRLFTEAMDILEETEEIRNLPDLKGSGRAYSLHQAMLRDNNLKELVIQFENEKDRQTRRELFNNIVFTWAGVIDNPVDGRGEYVDDGRKIDAMEVFFNYRDENNEPEVFISEEKGKTLMEIYDSTFMDTVYNNLLMETHFKHVLYSVDKYKDEPAHLAMLLDETIQETDEPEILTSFVSILNKYSYISGMDMDDFVRYFEEERPEYMETINNALSK